MFCIDRYNCTLDDILYGTKIEDMAHFLGSTPSVERNSYGNVAGWLGVLGGCHTPVLYQNG